LLPVIYLDVDILTVGNLVFDNKAGNLIVDNKAGNLVVDNKAGNLCSCGQQGR
jgi:hypothetical protein